MDLSDEGIKQAKKAGQLVKEAGFEFDQAYTSVLTRAIKTLHYVLEESNQLWVPEKKTWRLNERNYGALQGKNKNRAIEKWGESKVHAWRRSYDVLPLLDAAFKNSIFFDRRYENLDPRTIPDGESLKMTVERVIPFWEDEIAPKLINGEDILIVAHGNSLRALVKYIENISDKDIISLEMKTGQPIAYDFNDKLEIESKNTLV